MSILKYQNYVSTLPENLNTYVRDDWIQEFKKIYLNPNQLYLFT